MKFWILLSVAVLLIAAIFVFNRTSDLKSVNTQPPQSDQSVMTGLNAGQNTKDHEPDDGAHSKDRDREGRSQYPVAEFDGIIGPPAFQSTAGIETSGRQHPVLVEKAEAEFENDNSPDASRWTPRNWDLIGRHEGIFTNKFHRLESDFETIWDGSTSASITSLNAVESRTAGGILQIINAQNYRGQRIKYTGFLRARSLDSSNPAMAGLWLRADDEVGAIAASQNMRRRLIPGNDVWSEATIIIDIPFTASVIYYGAYLQGGGSVWIDDLNLDSVDLTYPLTAPPFDGQGFNRLPNPEKVLDSPTNLNFEFVISYTDQ